MAEDNGQPTRLSSSVEVIVEIMDVNAQAPTFEHSLYEITVKEDLEVGSCILQVCSFIIAKQQIIKYGTLETIINNQWIE